MIKYLDLSARSFFTCSLLLLAFSLTAQKIKMTYEPKDKILKFHYEQLTIYTDMNALYFMAKDTETSDYALHLIHVVQKQFSINHTDTLSFSGDFILYNESTDIQYQRKFYIEHAIHQLTLMNRLKIYNRHGKVVRTIILKKKGTERKGLVERVYMDKKTRKELFRELLYLRTVTPAF